MTSLPLTAQFWQDIDLVLLDLDGTLLDLHYDSHFWHEVVPAAWGAPRGLSGPRARRELESRFRACEGTLDWYCIDYWSRELQLDIGALKRVDTTRISWHRGARDFVRRVRARSKRTVLATNSHPRVLALKDERARLLAEFDAAYSSHEFGAPKEDPLFWQGLRAVEPFDPARTLFIDDSLSVLRAARNAGIEHLIAIRRPDSRGAPHIQDEFAAVDAIAELT